MSFIEFSRHTLQVLDFMIFITTISMATIRAPSAGGTGSLAPINSGRSSALSNKSRRAVNYKLPLQTICGYHKHSDQFYLICVLFP